MDRKCSFSPSSTVKGAPQLGHLSSVGFILISAQPWEKAARKLSARNVAAKFFIPNNSLGRSLIDIFKNITYLQTKKAWPQVERSGPVSKVPIQKCHCFLPGQFALLGVYEIKDMSGPRDYEKLAAFPG